MYGGVNPTRYFRGGFSRETGEGMRHEGAIGRPTGAPVAETECCEQRRMAHLGRIYVWVNRTRYYR